MSSSVVSNVNPVTEDFTRIGGFIAGCGEASLLVLLHGAKGTPTDPTTLGNVIRSAASQGWVQSDGTSTPSGLTKLSNSFGVPLTSGDWQTMLSQYAGSRPVIVGVANASAFGGRDAGVSGHYVAVVGKDSSGNFIVSDPNASSKFGKFDTYSSAQFAAARPFWAAVPTNWTGASTALSAAQTAAGTVAASLNPLDPSTWIAALQAKFGTLFTWLTDPLRILKLIAGVGMIGAAVLVTVASLAIKTAPDALEVAGTATGQPEIAAAGRIAGAAKKGNAKGAARAFAKARGRRRSPPAPRATTGPKPAATPTPAKATAPEPPKETPVYYGGKRVGVERDGEVIMDKPPDKKAKD